MGSGEFPGLADPRLASQWSSGRWMYAAAVMTSEGRGKSGTAVRRQKNGKDLKS